MTPATADPDHFTSQLLAWYADHGRDFPWRQTSDPYRILICEVLLRRSRSTTVAKVADLFFERWPSAAKLAMAEVDEVITVIRPLGLTGRASQLVSLGQALTDRKEFPKSVDDLVALPGVGRYAAAATLGRPAVDGTSARVYRRYFGLLDAPEHKTVDAALWAFVGEIDSGDDAVKHRANWAALDLASMICLPQYPECTACPLSSACTWALQ